MFKMNANFAWFFVIFGGIIECFWVSGLKYADTLFLHFLTYFGIFISFCCFTIAMKYLEISVAYAVFVGIGTAGVVINEIVIFDEKFSILKIVLIAILLFSVVGLKIASKEDK